jgi:hypothetical protein
MRYDKLLGSEDHVLRVYDIKTPGVPVSTISLTARMYFSESLGFILASPAFPAAAVLPAKRGSPIDDVIDTSKLQSRIRDQALCRVGSLCSSFADRLGDLSTTDRNFQSRFTTYERNTGVPHPLSGSIQLSGRANDRRQCSVVVWHHLCWHIARHGVFHWYDLPAC